MSMTLAKTNAFQICFISLIINVRSADSNCEDQRICVKNYVATEWPLLYCIRRAHQKADWYQARESCAADGAILPLNDNKTLMDAFRAAGLNNEEVTWLGFYRQGHRYTYLTERSIGDEHFPEGCGYLSNRRTFTDSCESPKFYFCLRPQEPYRGHRSRPQINLAITEKTFTIICNAELRIDGDVYFAIDAVGKGRETVLANVQPSKTKQAKINTGSNKFCTYTTMASHVFNFTSDYQRAHLYCCTTWPAGCSSFMVVPFKPFSKPSEDEAMTPGGDSSDSEGLISTCTRQEHMDNTPCLGTNYVHQATVDTCLLVVERTTTWDSARAICQHQHHGDLARIDSQELSEAFTARLAGSSHTSYWMGLHDRSRDHYGLFHWLDDEEKASWVNWAPEKPSKAKVGWSCGAVNKGSGLWEDRACDAALPFICQQISTSHPAPPRLHTESPFGPATLGIGESVKTVCSAFHAEDARINFTISGNNATVLHGNHASLIYKKEDRGYFRHEGRCLLSSKVMYIYNVTKQMNATSMACCWVLKNGISHCAEPVDIEAIFVCQMPHLEIDQLTTGQRTFRPGQTLFATCSALVGTGGQLVWGLTLKSKTLKWNIYLDGSQKVLVMEPGLVDRWTRVSSKDEVAFYGIIVNKRYEFDDDLGPRITSTFTMNLTWEMDKGQLRCQSLQDGFGPGYTRSRTTSVSLTVSGKEEQYDEFKFGYEIFIIAGAFLVLVIFLVACMWTAICN